MQFSHVIQHHFITTSFLTNTFFWQKQMNVKRSIIILMMQPFWNGKYGSSFNECEMRQKCSRKFTTWQIGKITTNNTFMMLILMPHIPDIQRQLPMAIHVHLKHVQRCFVPQFGVAAWQLCCMVFYWLEHHQESFAESMESTAKPHEF